MDREELVSVKKLYTSPSSTVIKPLLARIYGMWKISLQCKFFYSVKRNKIRASKTNGCQYLGSHSFFNFILLLVFRQDAPTPR
jgi:hypothetical protein